MEDSSTFSEIAKQLPIKEAYNDLLHPAAAAVGQTISFPFRAVNVLLSPFQKWLIQGEARLDEMSRLVSEELKDVPSEKLTDPEPYVVVPALQAFSYSMDCEELKKMYAKLLAKAIHVDEKKQVLPSYVEIIKQLSPLDARTLKSIYEKNAVAVCNIRWQVKSPPLWTDLPSFHIYANGGIIYQHFVMPEGNMSEVDVTVSFESLNRLGLIELNDTFHLDKEHYECFEKSNFVLSLKDKARSNPESSVKEIALIPATARITAFGEAFAKVCLSDNSNPSE